MNDGKALEDRTAAALSASGYTVKPEQLVGSKKVDLIAEQLHFGKRRTIAVECKDYSKPLTRDQVTNILTDYSELFDSRKIDELLMVTRMGLAPGATAFIEGKQNCSHQTLTDLERSIIDFSPYLNHLISSYHYDKVSRYYVPLKLDDGRDLASVVMEWLGAQESTKPLAVLGSYGMGKTTFAANMAASLAKEALKNPHVRIPIIIPLNLISAEQTLEGLLGRQFDAMHSLRGYTYSAFNTLNISGQFVVFLDGFDEMKHALNRTGFRFNFQQLLRLVVPRSRVIVLGRPTAFLSPKEQEYILHGKYQRQGAVFTISDWVDFHELRLAPFGEPQIREFMKNYCSSTDEDEHRYDTRRATQLMQDITSKQIHDLAKRPVQLKMLVEVLPTWKGDLRDLSVVALYDHFIDLIIERELEKEARKHFSKKEIIRRFTTELAWWLWTDKDGTVMSADVIPDSIIADYVADQEDIDGVRRSLVTASPLETKFDGSLYFPHRSIQEFLVADKTYELIMEGESNIQLLSSAMTGEVATFFLGILGGKDVDAIRRWLSQIRSYRGAVSQALFKTLAEHECVLGLVVSKARNTGSENYIQFAADRSNPWLSLLMILVFQKPLTSQSDVVGATQYFLTSITPDSAFHAAILNFFCAVLINIPQGKRGIEELTSVLLEAKSRFEAMIANDRFSSRSLAELSEVESFELDPYKDQEEMQKKLERRSASRVRDPTRRTAGPKIERQTAGPKIERHEELRRVRDFMERIALGGKEVVADTLVKEAIQSLSGYTMFSEWIDHSDDLAADLGLPERINMDHRVGDAESKGRSVSSPAAQKERQQTLKRNPKKLSH